MNTTEKLKINEMCAPTWNSLGINYAEISADDYTDVPAVTENIPDGIKLEKVSCPAKYTLDIKTGAGDEFAFDLMESSAPPCYIISKSAGTDEAPARFDISAENGNSALRFEIKAAENTFMNVMMYVKCPAGKTDRAGLLTLVKAEKNAKVRLVQVFEGGSGEFVNDVGAWSDDDSSFELIHLYLGGGKTFSGINEQLFGRNSSFSASLGYKLGGSDSLDINLRAYQAGKKTSSEIDAKGVLDGNAKKIFRGVIDFDKGSSGSVGRENEEVLLMSEKTVNKTAPLILCGEEDVDGTHGATIGRISDEHIFYMQSRGIPEKQVYKLMAESKINHILRRINDEEITGRVSDYLERSGE